ncbi:hypothetical protein D3C78_644820 [compost metagenome]
MPAIRHQAAADKRTVRQRVEKQQFTHGVAEQHRRISVDRHAGRAADRIETLLLTKPEYRIETLGVARYQNQQRIRVAGEQLPVGGQHHLVFAFMGTRGDPHRTLDRLPLLAQPSGALQQLRVDTQVKFDRSGDLHRLCPCTELPETLGFGFGLHGKQAHFSQHRLSQTTETAVASGRAL